MLRILSSRRYWNLISTISSLKAENKQLKQQLQQKTDSLMYVNGKLNQRTAECIRLKNQLEAIRSCQGLDFPETSKVHSFEDINQILGL